MAVIRYSKQFIEQLAKNGPQKIGTAEINGFKIGNIYSKDGEIVLRTFPSFGSPSQVIILKFKEENV